MKTILFKLFYILPKLPPVSQHYPFNARICAYKIQGFKEDCDEKCNGADC